MGQKVPDGKSLFPAGSPFNASLLLRTSLQKVSRGGAIVARFARELCWSDPNAPERGPGRALRALARRSRNVYRCRLTVRTRFAPRFSAPCELAHKIPTKERALRRVCRIAERNM